MSIKGEVLCQIMTEPARTWAAVSREKQAKSTNAAKVSKTNIDTVRMVAVVARAREAQSTARARAAVAENTKNKSAAIFISKPFD